VPTLDGLGFVPLICKHRVGPAPMDPRVRSPGNESASCDLVALTVLDQNIDRTRVGSVLEPLALVS
jgi:hypothetical protein